MLSFAMVDPSAAAPASCASSCPLPLGLDLLPTARASIRARDPTLGQLHRALARGAGPYRPGSHNAGPAIARREPDHQNAHEILRLSAPPRAPPEEPGVFPGLSHFVSSFLLADARRFHDYPSLFRHAARASRATPARDVAYPRISAATSDHVSSARRDRKST